MSLFKAYSEATKEDQDESNRQWLENSSFDQKSVMTCQSTTNLSKKQLDEIPIPYETILSKKDTEKELFIVDTKGDERLLTVDTLRGKAAPRFSNRPTRDIKRKKKKCKRYSKAAANLDTKPTEFTLHEQDKLLRNRLTNNENDIELWTEFINNQSRYVTVGNLKAVTERQISIIDEALLKNPNNAKLYEMWFTFNKKIYPYDDFAKIVIARTQKDSGNFLLWMGLIDYTQESVSECNVNVVLELYRKAISSFKKFRNQNILNNGVLFKLFQRASLFLRQAGSWKELLYLLEYTMWLNCGDMIIEDIFKFPEISHSNLIELEETVLQSGLPLSEIWYRIELLRETYSWSTVNNSFKDMVCALTIEEMDDLTTVFSKDTSKFHLLMHILVILRVPMLPHRQTINTLLGMNEIAWHADCSENMLAMFHDLDIVSPDILQILYNMLVTITDGPQYWGPRPFTSDYFEFVLSLIKNFMVYSKTDEEAKLYFGLLYIRFMKLHLLLTKYSRKQVNNKSIKKRIKTFLSENSDIKSSTLLYVEYAKVEVALSGIDSGLNTLKVLIESTDHNLSDYPYLIKTYISLLMTKYGCNLNKSECLNLLTKIVHNGMYSEDKIPILLEKFYNTINYEMDCTEVTASLLLPNPYENWLCCGAYFIYFTSGIEKALEYIKLTSQGAPAIVKEGLHEWAASLVYDTNNARHLQDYIKFGISEYPNNCILLMAYLMMCPQWMKLKPVLGTSLFGVVLLASHAKLQADRLSEISDKAAYQNRELSVLNDAVADPILQQNPFMWKLHLQTLYECGSDKIMDTMTQALEKFPWLKALYVSGVRYAPQEHSSFQDIIAEKELSLLALPEELEILREDNPD